ncbi:permease [Aminobacter sp. HY435]|uniref:permease n=1 Tax=Aminobacter sp. HY435 TaxID=2970917 RepID=UPI0022B95207|nr:permease [Aminobacter sp. HY435]
MDFMRLLKSLEELLYELASWLVFYPMTLWRTLRRPQAMMRYADVELGDEVDDQYTDTLSPPMFLLITLLLAHGFELALVRQETPWAPPSFLASDANLLLFRAVAFSFFPLLMALRLLRHRGIRIDRNTLRRPFYSQCYVAAPFALVTSIGGVLTRIDTPATVLSGVALFGCAMAWYLTVETRWFARHLELPLPRAALMVLGVMAAALVAVILAGAVIAFGLASA